VWRGGNGGGVLKLPMVLGGYFVLVLSLGFLIKFYDWASFRNNGHWQIKE